jgi:hypothetical protein
MTALPPKPWHTDFSGPFPSGEYLLKQQKNPIQHRVFFLILLLL